MRFKFLMVFLITSSICNAQNLDLVEGFYEIIGRENSRQILLRGDSALVYFIAEQPVVCMHDRIATKVDQETNALYFYYDEPGTKKLLDFTRNHPGGKLGFVYLGSLRKIYTIEEIVDNGIIEFSSDRIYKVNRKLLDLEK